MNSPKRRNYRYEVVFQFNSRKPTKPEPVLAPSMAEAVAKVEKQHQNSRIIDLSINGGKLPRSVTRVPCKLAS